MAVIYTREGTNDDGSPRFSVRTDDPTKTLVLTGPIYGPVRVPDGTEYDVSAPVIEVTIGHELQVSDAIAARHAADGHPWHDDAHPFFATPSGVSHNPDGTPSEVFAETVHEHTAPDRDSSPPAVAAAVEAKQKG